MKNSLLDLSKFVGEAIYLHTHIYCMYIYIYKQYVLQGLQLGTGSCINLINPSVCLKLIHVVYHVKSNREKHLKHEIKLSDPI